MTNPKYLEAVIDWYKRRHNCILSKDWLTSAPNVITGIMWCIGAFTKPNDAIAVLSPVYGAFDTSASDAQRQIIAIPMKRSDDNRYTVDYEAFETAITMHDVKLFIHCNPHNPVGHVWTETEMDRLFNICKQHNVLIISDEIHQDLITGSTPFTSALAVASGAGLLVLGGMLLDNPYLLVGAGLFHSVMWGAIFSLAIDKLGKYTSAGSGALMMGIFGGAILPFAQGFLADSLGGWQWTWIIVVVAEAYLLFYALSGHKVKQLP